MARQFHIDGATALVVDGVRFELQTVQFRIRPEDPIHQTRMWVKSSVQNNVGFNVAAPIYLPFDVWYYYDDYGNEVRVVGVVYKERTWHYYGTAGYSPSATRLSITTLSPWAVDEVTGKVLAFDDVRTGDWTSAPMLYFGSDHAYINGAALNEGGANRFQFWGLGIRPTS